MTVVDEDITSLLLDAIINAANESLMGHDGADGAILRAAGPALLGECQTLGGCSTGDAKITVGDDLLARHLPHTVGPVWQVGDADEEVLLAKLWPLIDRTCGRKQN